MVVMINQFTTLKHSDQAPPHQKSKTNQKNSLNGAKMSKWTVGRTQKCRTESTAPKVDDNDDATCGPMAMFDMDGPLSHMSRLITGLVFPYLYTREDYRQMKRQEPGHQRRRAAQGVCCGNETIAEQRSADVCTFCALSYEAN